MPGDITDAAIGARMDPALALPLDEKHEGPASNHEVAPLPVAQGQASGRHDSIVYADSSDFEHGEYPTAEEIQTLRRVPDHIDYKVYALAFVELVERFSYYGTTVVCK
jgi:POT family proton-dependent oligopeptide transporter